MSERVDLRWSEPGPVAKAFFVDPHEISVINGPVGSGKTTTAIMKAVHRAARQAPSPIRRLPGPGTSELWPVRMRKTCVVRDTYRQLWRSTMPSWFSRFPKSMGSFTGAENAPSTHVITFARPDRTLVEWQVDFIAIGDQAVEDVLRGYEPSDFYLNELDTLAEEVFIHAVGRYGRYPSAEHGGCTLPGILADCNAPILESWLYAKMFLLTPAELHAQGIGLFRQPGGLDPGAENLANLPGGRGYYQRMERVNPDWFVQRMVHNRPGFSRAGKPVYPEFNDLVHVAPAALPGVPQLPLVIGLDAGLSPSAAFCQQMPGGAWHVLDELVGEAGTGATRFGDMLAQFLRTRFGAFRDTVAWCDPSALYGADRDAGEQDWSEIVMARTGLRIRAAPTNQPIPRWEAVRVPLGRMIDGRPGFVLSPECRVLRAGFNSGYHFRKVQGTAGRYAEQAEKTPESHVHDALQYALSGGGEDAQIRRRRADDAERWTAMQSTTSPEWNPYAAA